MPLDRQKIEEFFTKLPTWSLMLAVASLILHMAVFIAPSWYGGANGQAGLWRWCTYTPPMCQNDMRHQNDQQKAAAAMMVIAFASLLMATVGAVLQHCCKDADKLHVKLQITGLFVAAAAIMLTLILWGSSTGRFREALGGEVSLRWAYFLAILVCVLACFGGVLASLHACFNKDENDDNRNFSTAILEGDRNSCGVLPSQQRKVSLDVKEIITNTSDDGQTDQRNRENVYEGPCTSIGEPAQGNERKKGTNPNTYTGEQAGQEGKKEEQPNTPTEEIAEQSDVGGKEINPKGHFGERSVTVGNMESNPINPTTTHSVQDKVENKGEEPVMPAGEQTNQRNMEALKDDPVGEPRGQSNKAVYADTSYITANIKDEDKDGKGQASNSGEKPIEQTKGEQTETKPYDERPEACQGTPE